MTTSQLVSPDQKPAFEIGNPGAASRIDLKKTDSQSAT
jgi:hypothetical protein